MNRQRSFFRNCFLVASCAGSILCQAGTIRRVSTGVDGVQSRGNTQTLQVSSNGRYILFSNDGDNMVAKARAGMHHYWKDLETDRLVPVEVPSVATPDRVPFAGSLSRDGQTVAILQPVFDERKQVAKRLLIAHPGVQNGASQVVRIHRGQIELWPTDLYGVSRDGLVLVVASSHPEQGGRPPDFGLYSVDTKTGDALFIAKGGGVASISDDGLRVAFDTPEALSRKDTNGAADVYVFQRQGSSGTIRRVSTSEKGIEGNDRSGGAFVSPDGRFVAFQTWATNLIPGVNHPAGWNGWMTADTSNDHIFGPQKSDWFLGFIEGPAMVTGTFEQLDVTSLSDGTTRTIKLQDLGLNRLSAPTAISQDGKRLFVLTNEALDERDTNGNADVYVVDLPAPLGSQAAAVDAVAQGAPPAISEPSKMEAPRETVGAVAAPRAPGEPGPLDPATLKRISGRYTLSARDATGGEVTDTLTINEDGTATTDFAKKMGIDRLTVSGSDMGMMLYMSVTGTKQDRSIEITLMLQANSPAQCIFVQKRSGSVEKYYQFKVEKKP